MGNRVHLRAPSGSGRFIYCGNIHATVDDTTRTRSKATCKACQRAYRREQRGIEKMQAQAFIAHPDPPSAAMEKPPIPETPEKPAAPSIGPGVLYYSIGGVQIYISHKQDGIEDLRKAVDYLSRAVNFIDTNLKGDTNHD